MNLNPLKWLSTFYYDYLAPFLGIQKKATILFIGLDHAGKTTLLYRLKEDRMTQATPTMLPPRIVWRTYLPVADGIIFIIDGSDRERFAESAAELTSLLRNEDVAEIPVAVLVNKIDLEDAAGEYEIITLYDLYGKTTGKDYRPVAKLEGRPLEVFPCSVLLRQGYGQALQWLADYVK